MICVTIMLTAYCLLLCSYSCLLLFTWDCRVVPPHNDSSAFVVAHWLLLLPPAPISCLLFLGSYFSKWRNITVFTRTIGRGNPFINRFNYEVSQSFFFKCFMLFFFPLMKKEPKKSRLILVFLNSTFYCIIVSRLFIWFPNRVEDKLWTLAIP